MGMQLYAPKLHVEEGAKLRVYTFGGVPEPSWNRVRDAVRGMDGVERVDGSFQEGVAMWVRGSDGADWEALDMSIVTCVMLCLPDDSPVTRGPFRGY